MWDLHTLWFYFVWHLSVVPSGSRVRPRPHVTWIRSKLGLKCLFHPIKTIYFLYNKENAIQHHHCTSWSTSSVTMATNSIPSGIRIDVRSWLVFYWQLHLGFFFFGGCRKFEEKVVLFLWRKALFKHDSDAEWLQHDHFSGANSMDLQMEMSTRQLWNILKMELWGGSREGESLSR